MKHTDADKQAVKEITKTVRKEIASQVKEAMDSLNEKIAKATESWKGVDVDKFMDEVRGREPEVDLEKFAREYCKTIFHKPFSENPQEEHIVYDPDKYAEFKAGAEWQKDQFEKNRLAHCDKLTKEEYDREMAFSNEIIEKEHRQPTFTDAINYGIRLQKEQDTREMIMSDGSYFRRCYELGKKDMKEQMMSESVEGEVHPDDCEIWVNLVGYGYKFNDGDKVKLIVIKED